MKKKIDFRQVEVITLDGEKKVVDISKPLGNHIFNETGDLGEFELAKEIYDKGEVEIEEHHVEVLNGYIRRYFKAFIQAAICPVLENLFTNKK